MVEKEEKEEKVNGVHPTMYKTFLVLAMVSFSLGALAWSFKHDFPRKQEDDE